MRRTIAVYMMANRRRGAIYVGVTSDLERRVSEHRQGLTGGFTAHYGCKSLVWYEAHDEVVRAIQRETSLKRWLRAWKVALIERENPDWADLAAEWWGK